MTQRLNPYSTLAEAESACLRLMRDPYQLSIHEIRKPDYEVKQDATGIYISATYYPFSRREFTRKQIRNRRKTLLEKSL